METTTARRRSTHPMSYYRDMVKDMDDSQKLELVAMNIDSIRPVSTAPLAEHFRSRLCRGLFCAVLRSFLERSEKLCQTKLMNYEL